MMNINRESKEINMSEFFNLEHTLKIIYDTIRNSSHGR